MSTVCSGKNLSPASCEKSILLRHVILLPKIAHPPASRSSAGHSITMFTLILIGIGTKRDNKSLYSPDYQ